VATAPYKIETTFINNWSDGGFYELEVNINTSEAMRRQNIDLVDVNHVLKTGDVVRSDMLDTKGLWDIYGETIDGVELELKILVNSTEFEVGLVRVIKVKRNSK